MASIAGRRTIGEIQQYIVEHLLEAKSNRGFGLRSRTAHAHAKRRLHDSLAISGEAAQGIIHDAFRQWEILVRNGVTI